MLKFKAKYSFHYLGREIISELETHTLGQSFGFDVAMDLLKKFREKFPGERDKKKFLDYFTQPVKFREKIKYSIECDGKEIKDKDIAKLITYPIAEYFMKKF